MGSESEVLILLPAVLDSEHAEGADPKEATRQHHLNKSCDAQRNVVVGILPGETEAHVLPAQTAAPRGTAQDEGKKTDGQPIYVVAQCERHNIPV